MPFSIRIPDVLYGRIKAASDGSMAEWILEACRMRLDGDTSVAEEAGGTSVGGSIPPPQSIKPDMQALRDICAGKIGEAVYSDSPPLIPFCTYTEYDGTTGQNMKCGLYQHGSKQRHGNWQVVD